jgi:hypothetical protein
MPGLNTTGAPNTRDYTLGRGIVRLAKLTAAGLPDADGFRDLGNAPEFNITVSAEDVRHQSSRTQLKFTDKRCTISQEVGVSFQLDEMNFQNLADFFAGSTESYDNPHDTTWTDAEDALISSSVKLGNWYQLKDDNGERVYDLGAAGITYVVEEDPAGTPQVLVLGTDFEVDAEMGLIRFLPGSILVADGDTVGWNITAGASTPQDLDQVNALTVADVTGALLFIQVNACDQGNKTEYLFHKVSLSSDGDLPLIGDDIQVASFTGVAEVNSAVTDTSQVLTVRSYDQQA